MSWLKKIFEPPPKPSPPPEPDWQQKQLDEFNQVAPGIYKEFVTGLNQRISEEYQQLKRYALPYPIFEGDFSYAIGGQFSIEMILPRVTTQPYLALVVNATEALGLDPHFNTPEQLIFLCLVGAKETITQAEQTLQSAGIIELMRSYPVQWFNRDPYQFFNRYAYVAHTLGLRFFPQRDMTGVILSTLRYITGQTFDDSASNTKPLAEVPLVKLAGYTPEQLRQFDRHISFYNGLADCSEPLQLTGELLIGVGGGGSIVPTTNSWQKQYRKPLVFGLELPEPAFTDDFITLKIIAGEPTRPNIAREFLDSLRPITRPLAFELIDNNTAAYFQITCAPDDRMLVAHQVELHFPTAAVIEQPPAPLPPMYFVSAQPAALHHSMRVVSDFPLDPLTQLFSTLDKCSPDETSALQILCFPIPNALLTQVSEVFKNQGMTEEAKRVERKLPAWQATIRAFCSRRDTLAKLQANFFGQYAVAPHEWKFSEPKLGDFAERDMSEWAMLTTSELAGVLHLPTAQPAFDRLEMATMKAKLPPDLFTTGEVHIGTSEARGQTKPVMLPDSIRARHLYVVGKSGSGKSTLITNIARQDIERGDGVCVIDPHGDLVSDLLDYIPEDRVKDTIYFNVSDRAHPIGLDMLNAKSEAEIELLTDDLITMFRRLTETWGERMETILRYSFNTLLRTPGATFLDLQKLLTNEGWRSTVVRKLDFPPLAEFWFNQFANMPKDATQPILSRMTKIVLSPTLNAIFGQSESTLNFNDVIRNRKILLINLGGDSRDRNNEQLAVSDEMKKLIGSVVVSQLQLAAMRQASIPEHARIPCRFFVDEFQNFVSGAFPKILSEARKYKLCLTVAHQYISQLDDSTRNAVFGNVGTMVVMPLGQKDAAYLGAELGSYTPEDVANLSAEKHEALCRPSTMASDTFLFSTLPPQRIIQSFANEVISHSRTEYSQAPESVMQAQPQAASEAEDRPSTKIPMRETPKEFASTSEKILHFASQANYLTTSQIIELCYSHLSGNSKRPAASRDLKKLTDAKKLKSINWGDGKVFYVGRECNPTAHNVAVRDILIKILQSGYEVAEVNLSPTLGALSPDLLVSFLCTDGSLLPTYWEYDTGTEGITEIIKKAARYVPYSGIARICFVCSTSERVQAIMKAVKEGFIEFAILDEFTKLDAPAFISPSHLDRYSFF
jgi:hypothetical protein